ncbi:putative ATPase, archaeal AAA+ ATPase superfamily, partial [Candidatus Vampirococcus lugosii]|nr:putative ATPase, archaeal AAA+ ATPase superfamily [Candidatus Vampirococcus lugosii]
MAELNIELKYCGNIEKGVIKLEKEKLNIKYAINGTGKSTIARAFKYYLEKNEEDEKLLKPYKYIGDNTKKSEILGLEDIKKIKIFNEDYIKQYTFKKDEILENSFSIFIENETYKKGIQEVDNLVKNLRGTFQENPDLDKLISDTDNFLDFVKINQGGDINQSSTIFKGLESARKINNPGSDFLGYSNYLKNNSINSRYVAWQIQGKEYLGINEKECPCCISKIEDSRIQSIEKFSTEYKKADIDNFNKILDVIDGLFEYFNSKTKETINAIKENISDIGEEQKSFLRILREQVYLFNISLKKLKILDFYNLKDIENIEEEVKKY